MSRTIQISYISIPANLPGKVMVNMAGSISSLTNPSIEDGKIYFAAAPAFPWSLTVRREVFFQRPGTTPSSEATFQHKIKITDEEYDVYLSVDGYNRQRL